MDLSQKKRLFFALEVMAPWPLHLPSGRIIHEDQRHVTLAFLGDVSYSPLEKQLAEIPLPAFSLGLVGEFDQPLFLPEKRPHVAAWHVNWLSQQNALIEYQKSLVHWLQAIGYSTDRRPLLSHVTLARTPFNILEWKKAFALLPCMAYRLHLYESLGNSNYQPIWTHTLQAPFEEIEHTADIAFLIRGKNYEELYTHALTALAFRFPPILRELHEETIGSLEKLIAILNEKICKLDATIGCPFKALSFHGKLQPIAGHLLEWEMIVDV